MSEREYKKACDKPPEHSFIGNVVADIWDFATGSTPQRNQNECKSAKKFLPDMSLNDDDGNIIQKKKMADVGQDDNVIYKKKMADVGQDDNVFQKKTEYSKSYDD